MLGLELVDDPLVLAEGLGAGVGTEGFSSGAESLKGVGVASCDFLESRAIGNS